MTASTINPADQMERAAQGVMQMIEEVKNFNQESAEAVMRSLAVLTKGMNETATSASHLMKENMARAVSTGKTIMAARNPRDMMDAQMDFMKECVESFMSGTGKLSEISARTTKEAIEPVAQHATGAMNKMAQKATRAA